MPYHPFSPLNWWTKRETKRAQAGSSSSSPSPADLPLSTRTNAASFPSRYLHPISQLMPGARSQPGSWRVWVIEGRRFAWGRRPAGLGEDTLTRLGNKGVRSSRLVAPHSLSSLRSVFPRNAKRRQVSRLRASPVGVRRTSRLPALPPFRIWYAVNVHPACPVVNTPLTIPPTAPNNSCRSCP
jgi:hypothetical protein